MKRVYIYTGVALLVGLVIGAWATVLWPKDYTPSAVVIVADDTVSAPQSLLAYLENEANSDCNDYKGTDTVKGVTLVSVYQVVQDKYAKVALGCSTNLSMDFPVVKTQDGWKILSTSGYYLSISGNDLLEETSLYPRCSIIDKYQIPKEFEPACLTEKGADDATYTGSDLKENTYN